VSCETFDFENHWVLIMNFTDAFLVLYELQTRDRNGNYGEKKGKTEADFIFPSLKTTQ
jgi:hypothetical protein